MLRYYADLSRGPDRRRPRHLARRGQEPRPPRPDDPESHDADDGAAMNTDPTPLDPDEAPAGTAALRDDRGEPAPDAGRRGGAHRARPTDSPSILTEAHARPPVDGSPPVARAGGCRCGGRCCSPAPSGRSTGPTGTAPVGGPTVASRRRRAQHAAPPDDARPTSADADGAVPALERCDRPAQPDDGHRADAPTGPTDGRRGPTDRAPDDRQPDRRRRRSPLPVYYLGPVVAGSERAAPLPRVRARRPCRLPCTAGARPWPPCAWRSAPPAAAGAAAMPHRGAPPIRAR